MPFYKNVKNEMYLLGNHFLNLINQKFCTYYSCFSVSVEVDLRSRCSLSAGVPVSFLGALRLWDLTCTVLPQESSTFRSNQLNLVWLG